MKIHVVKTVDKHIHDQVIIKQSNKEMINNISDSTMNLSLSNHIHHWNEKTKTIHHEAQTKTEIVTFVDQEAYDEIVVTGYQCDCGAIKEK